MKFLLLIMTIMAATSTLAQDGKASTIKRTFSRETSISISIQADPTIVWTLLTNASDYPRWNSTIIKIEGEIGYRGKIDLTSTLDEKRTFKLKVKEFEPEKRMVWGDGKGNRAFTITQEADERITFEMREKIGGLMFPMYAKFIPPFDQAFEQFASDLKTEAELISNS